MTEFVRMMEECNGPLEYILDLFQKDLKSENFILEKSQYRNRKNILKHTKGCYFLSKGDLNCL